MAIAAGVPMPKVYIIDDPSPNAFATGRDPQHSSVAITTGLLNKLNREELQGVLGHEMSHVRNYDIRFTLIVGVMVGSIALLADFFLRYTFWFGGGRRGNDREGGGSGGLGVILLVVGLVMAVVSYFFGALVQMAVSRQREYLADASSVELTRNPHGLECPGQDRRRPGVAALGQRRHSAPLHRQSPEEARHRFRPLLDPSTDRRSHQPAAPADRRGAHGPDRREGSERARVGSGGVPASLPARVVGDPSAADRRPFGRPCASLQRLAPSWYLSSRRRAASRQFKPR